MRKRCSRCSRKSSRDFAPETIAGSGPRTAPRCDRGHPGWRSRANPVWRAAREGAAAASSPAAACGQTRLRTTCAWPSVASAAAGGGQSRTRKRCSSALTQARPARQSRTSRRAQPAAGEGLPRTPGLPACLRASRRRGGSRGRDRDPPWPADGPRDGGGSPAVRPVRTATAIPPPVRNRRSSPARPARLPQATIDCRSRHVSSADGPSF